MVMLRQRLMVALKQLQGELLREAQTAPMQTREGAESLHEGALYEIADTLVAEVVGGAWAAMSEWGTGSRMDISNPALEHYMDGDLWNPYRNDIAIRSRDSRDNPYVDIFGKTRKTRSRRGGINLEKHKSGKYKPIPPSHALRTAARWMRQGRLQQVLSQAVSGMPWHKFVVVGKE